MQVGGVDFLTMNLLATSFDLANCRACASASDDAYRMATVSVPETDTHCVVIDAGDCLVVAFRGTDSIRDWITDAQFMRRVLMQFPNGERVEVHSGFLSAYNSILGPLTSKLRPFASRLIFVTGHSLGGALAKLSALELQRQGFNIAQVYTFGQPRVGNGAFTRLYDAALGRSTFRVVHEEDIVPRVPHLPAFHDPYRHAGVEVFLSSFGGMLVNPPLLTLLASDAWGAYRAFLVSTFEAALDPIYDHYLGNYTADLDALEEK